MTTDEREALRGERLLPQCIRAVSSGVEFERDGKKYYGCWGLMDWPYNYNVECQNCGAFVDNIPTFPEQV